MARRYRRETERVNVPGPQLSIRGARRRSRLWSDSSAQVTLNGTCTAAGHHTRAPTVASSYGHAPADGIVAPGRLTGRGDSRTRAPRHRCRGVRGGTRRMFHVVGREILSGPSWPLGTTASKAEPKSLPARPEVGGASRTERIAWETRGEGRSPASVMGLEGGWEVRWPYGEERSRKRPEPTESPLPSIHTGEGGAVVQRGRSRLEGGRVVGGLAPRQSHLRRTRSGRNGHRGDGRHRTGRGHERAVADRPADAPLPGRAGPGGRESQAERRDPTAGHRDGRRSRGADGHEAGPRAAC
jgi:hypothetical protein